MRNFGPVFQQMVELPYSGNENDSVNGWWTSKNMPTDADPDEVILAKVPAGMQTYFASAFDRLNVAQSATPPKRA